jgi:hypothetical protein
VKAKVSELEQTQTVKLTYDDLIKAMAAPKRVTRSLSGKEE